MGERKGTPAPKQEKEARKPWTLKEFGGKAVWDWLQLFGVLAIPVVIAVGGCMFNSQQNERLNELETQRAKAERELAERSAQDEALQTYLKQMDALLLEEDLASSPGGAVERTLARARTLSTLARLDGEHKKHVLLFLYEAGLIYKEDRVDFGIISQSVPDTPAAVDLGRADLSAANLSNLTFQQVDLSDADLSEAELDCDLTLADLRFADLRHAMLRDSTLRGADLTSSRLVGANLSNADLSNRLTGRVTVLANANLTDAKLNNADLTGAQLGEQEDLDAQGYGPFPGANLTGANLTSANLKEADLAGVTVTDAQLSTVKSLEGATMPNGQKYEDWRKSKGSREDG